MWNFVLFFFLKMNTNLLDLHEFNLHLILSDVIEKQLSKDSIFILKQPLTLDRRILSNPKAQVVSIIVLYTSTQIVDTYILFCIMNQRHSPSYDKEISICSRPCSQGLLTFALNISHIFRIKVVLLNCGFVRKELFPKFKN